MTGPTRAVAVAVVLGLGVLGVAACTSNDNGGVITGTNPPASTISSTTTVPPASTTSTALPGGTLPSS
jgi:hypothetical protein